MIKPDQVFYIVTRNTLFDLHHINTIFMRFLLICFCLNLFFSFAMSQMLSLRVYSPLLPFSSSVILDGQSYFSAVNWITDAQPHLQILIRQTQQHLKSRVSVLSNLASPKSCYKSTHPPFIKQIICF